MTTIVSALTPDPTGSTTPTEGTIRFEEDLIRAEIPGTVLEVTVMVGDRVTAGGVVALLESMKMEIPVIAESAGTVTRVAVAEGWTVRTGDIVAASLPNGAPTEEHSAHDLA